MKLTSKQLRQIIKEELASVLNEALPTEEDIWDEVTGCLEGDHTEDECLEGKDDNYVEAYRKQKEAYLKQKEEAEARQAAAEKAEREERMANPQHHGYDPAYRHLDSYWSN